MTSLDQLMMSFHGQTVHAKLQSLSKQLDLGKR